MDTKHMTGAPAPTSLRDRLTTFAREEDGSVLPFSMTVIFLLMMVGGLALDVMRHEERRVAIQQTLDNSVLAAASLKQTLPPNTVVTDYFAKLGMSEYLGAVNVQSGLNFRTVTAEASADTKPTFLKMLGIDEFTVNAESGAEERISNVEVSLVLDISGSMSGSRINNLRPAAKDFIDTILENSEPGRATMSIVPYAAQVNLGPDLMAQFNVTAQHDKTYCVELPDSTFNSIALSRTSPLIHNNHFDPWSNYQSGVNQTNCPWYSTWTTTALKASNNVLPISNNATVLKARVDSLVVGGNTSIDLGVKWGALLLTPTSRPITAGLISRGAVSSAHAARPLDFNAAETIKVLVVMTDGSNTTEYKVKPAYRDGNSPVWRNSSGQTATFKADRTGDKKYYWQSNSTWYATPPTGATQQTWQQLYDRYSVQNIAWNFYVRPGLATDFNTQYYAMLDTVYATKDARLQQICTAAKEAGVVIYGIGFEAPTAGRDQVRACASSPSHYYDAAGLQIGTVFQSIASQISMLRLTQ